MDNSKQFSFTNESVLSTPKPRASSTTQKIPSVKNLQLQKIPFMYSPDSAKNASSDSLESLGILCADDIHLTSGLNAVDNKHTNRQSQISEKLQQERALANSILQKTTSKTFGLPSQYFRPSDTVKNSIYSLNSDSTVNETDLLAERASSGSCGMQTKTSFAPADVSTPRSSCASNNSSPRTSLDYGSNMSKNIAEFSWQLRNSDLSLAELCERYEKLSSDASEFQFVPGELAKDKIAEQEQVWQKERDVLGGKARSDSLFSQMDLSNRLESNVSEFFRKKSELAELCLKDSPEKEAPVPLIDNSRSLVDCSVESMHGLQPDTQKSLNFSEDSSLSITAMEKDMFLCDNTANIVDYLEKAAKKLKTPKKVDPKLKNKENFDPTHTEVRFMAPPSSTPMKQKDVLKETIYYDNSPDRSRSSLHTASSLESLPSGKLPIETNRIELTWGCVRTCKRKCQTFILRNRSQNKLRLQIASSNVNFRILSDHSESDSVSVVPVLLYPAESRPFTIMFTPTTIGAAIGKLNFSPISVELQMQHTKRQQLMLYGYGGHSKLEIHNVFKDTNMKMWLSLGKLINKPQLCQVFTLINSGSIPGFACLSYNSKVLYGYSKVTVYPTELVLQPKEETNITVTYTPTKEDAKHLATTVNQVTEIGSIQITSGEEAIRGRIRRLCKKLTQESGSIGNPLLERLSEKFPNEKMPADLNRFTETVGSVKELMQTLDVKEIILTLEKDSENTLVGQIGGLDESSMFHSLSEGMITVVNSKTLVGSCIVEPNKLLLTPPTKTEDYILINSQNAYQFEISVSPPDILNVTPQEGIFIPGETSFIKVVYNGKRLQQPQVFKVSIYVDDDVFEVDVKVIFIKLPGK